MNKIKFISLTASIAFATAFTIGCAGKPPTTTSTPQQTEVSQSQKSGNPFGEVYEAPCTVYDDDDWFAAVGIANGPRTRMEVIQVAALSNAQNMVRLKMQHVYEGVISNYAKYIGNNQGTDADINVKTAGDQIIDQIVSNTNAVCGPKFSEVDSKGHVNAFTGIKVSKKEFANKIADRVENMVSKDERLRIEFEEKNYREEIAEKIRAYRESQSR